MTFLRAEEGAQPCPCALPPAWLASPQSSASRYRLGPLGDPDPQGLLSELLSGWTSPELLVFKSALEMLRQEDRCEFEAGQGDRVSSHLNKKGQ